jgi:hypothetical protein
MSTQDATLYEQRLSRLWRDAYDSDDLVVVLSALYASDIHVGAQSGPEMGWTFWFGENYENRVPTVLVGPTHDPEFLRDAVFLLKQAAEEYYPILRRRRLGV